METLDSLETADESSENSGLVKSEDESPNHGSGRNSPPPNCAICLGRCRNKSFTDSCLHQFCFKCLLTWSRVKTECPLCKQNFKSIIHNVKSNHQYEEYRVQQPQSEDRGPNLDFSDIFNAARRFRYRTTLTLPRRETMAIRQFLLHYPLSALMNELPPRAAPRERARRSPTDFRRTVYRHNLWARPLPDFTGRFRDCSPDFFRYNDSQVHRLVPWLSRELFYLLNENTGHVTYVLGRILELLPQHPILSDELRANMRDYLGDRTDHFLHEFHCFASTPYDITGYDRHVQYQTDARLAGAAVGPGLISEVLSSSDTDSNDSDIVMVSSSQAAPAPPAAGPSHADLPPTAPAYPQPAVIPIETISHSDSDSDSEVMVVGYIKPPHQRTPELVDLLASDSDVVVQEDEPAPEPAAGSSGMHSLVQIKMSVKPSGPRARSQDSSEGYTPPSSPQRRRRRARPPTPDRSYTPGPHSSTDDEYDSDSPAESTSSSDARRKRTVRRKPKKKSTRGSRSRGRPDGRDSRRTKEAKKTADGDRRIKGKSKNGKDVKSSRVDMSDSSIPQAAEAAAPSGVENLPSVDKKAKGKSKNGKGVKSSSVDMSDASPPPAHEQVGSSGVEDFPSAVRKSKGKSKNGKGVKSSSFDMSDESPPPAHEPAGSSGVEDFPSADRRSKGKSKNGKGVKSSSVNMSDASPPPAHEPVGSSGVEDFSSADRRSKGKSKNGKGVKYSRADSTSPPKPAPGTELDRTELSGREDNLNIANDGEPAPALEPVGPSEAEDGPKRKRSADSAPTSVRAPSNGVQDDSRKKRDPELKASELDGAGPSDLDYWLPKKRSLEPASVSERSDSRELTGGSNRKRSKGRVSRRETRGNKRLKSIVKVMKRDTSAGVDSSGSRAGLVDGGAGCSSARPAGKPSPDAAAAARSREDHDSTSSDDNIPLRSVLSKPYALAVPYVLSRTYVSDFSD